MKKTIQHLTLTIFAVIFCIQVNAQPVITSANMPAIGDSVIIGLCSNPVAAGPAGASQTWNMATLTDTAQGYFKFMLPSQTYWGYHFPTATICGKSWKNSYTYYISNATSLQQLGACLLMDTVAPPNDSVKSIHNDFETLLNLPFDFNDTHTDTFAGTNYAFGFSQPYTGNIMVEADGYGTLILPNGTYSNVGRYHFIRNQYSPSSPTQVKEQWGWISADHRFWLLLMETINDGISVSSLVWYNKQPNAVATGVSTVKKSTFDLYPNPVIPSQNLFIRWEKPEEVSVQITDVTGKIVHSEDRMMLEGNNSFDISHTIKNQGIYMVRIFNDGFVLNEKLVVLK